MQSHKPFYKLYLAYKHIKAVSNDSLIRYSFFIYNTYTKLRLYDAHTYINSYITYPSSTVLTLLIQFIHIGCIHIGNVTVIGLNHMFIIVILFRSHIGTDCTNRRIYRGLNSVILRTSNTIR